MNIFQHILKLLHVFMLNYFLHNQKNIFILYLLKK